MFRKSIPLIVIAALVIGVILGAALNAHPANAQAKNMKALIQSFIDKGQVFTINTRVTNYEVDGTNTKIGDLGDDYVCVSGDLNIMGKSMKTVCDSFDMIIIIIS